VSQQLAQYGQLEPMLKQAGLLPAEDDGADVAVQSLTSVFRPNRAFPACIFGEIGAAARWSI
jgi:hypothetical protein